MKQRLLKIVTIAGFVALVPMAVLATLRIVHWEHMRTVVEFETFTFYLLLPAYVILIFAILARQKALIGCAAVLVLCHITWTGPEFFGGRGLPAKAATATHLTLYNQNVMYDNQSPQQVGGQIHAVDADFVFLEELSVPDFDAIRSTGAFDNYKYSFVQSAYGPTGLGIFSKYPLTSTEKIASPGFPQMRAIADVNGKSVVLWNVHMRSPIDGPLTNWLGDYAQLRTRIHAETDATLVAGDFNGTWGHRPFRNLLTHGYHEAAVDLGQGYSRSWPVDTSVGRSVDGLIRLDHVLYNGGLQATHMHELPGGGSDHRAIVTQLDLF